jgi:hypothetical protein
MGTQVSETKLYGNMMQLGAGIETCLEKRLVTPALILLYSAIDIASWLASDNPNASVRDYFTGWVQDYVLSGKPLGCDALELYSARCGLVHTLTPDSRLVEQAGVRRIAYAWGTAKSSDLQSLIDRTGWSDRLVAVHVEELYEAWRLGLLAFTEALQENSQKATAVYERANKFFDNLAAEPFEALLGKDDRQAKNV